MLSIFYLKTLLRLFSFLLLLIGYTISYTINHASAFPNQEGQQQYLKIAAGSVLEGYYSIGLKLCSYISAANKGISCEVIPTSGSLENLTLLAAGKVDFAFTQSNAAIDAYNGQGLFAGKVPFKGLYQLLNLHNEIFTVIVKDQDKILTFADLEGKKISNGSSESDSTIPYLTLVKYYNFKNNPIEVELDYENYAREFCHGNIAAIIMMTGHPNALVNYITNSCESDFVSIDEDKIKLLLKDHPGFTKIILNGQKEYPGITKNYNTIGVRAIFVTSNKTGKKLVQNFIKYFDGKKEVFKMVHPTLYNLKAEHFTSDFVLPEFHSDSF